MMIAVNLLFRMSIAIHMLQMLANYMKRLTIMANSALVTEVPIIMDLTNILNLHILMIACAVNKFQIVSTIGGDLIFYS